MVLSRASNEKRILHFVDRTATVAEDAAAARFFVGIEVPTLNSSAVTLGKESTDEEDALVSEFATDEFEAGLAQSLRAFPVVEDVPAVDPLTSDKLAALPDPKVAHNKRTHNSQATKAS